MYFDNAATTKINPKVLESMLPYLTDSFGNPSSQHSFGRKVKVALEEAREIAADFINADPSEIYFTSGGTESDNTAIKQISEVNFSETGKKKVITSLGEHHAVTESCEALKSKGFQIISLGIEPSGNVSIDSAESNMDRDTSLVSLMHINNETGAISPISEIGKLAQKHNALMHTDAIQSFGKYQIDVKEMNIDSLSASSHKIHGPKGVGLLYVKSGTPFSSMLQGGSQERNRRAGTENIPGIIGFAEAIKIAKSYMADNQKYVSELKKYFIRSLEEIFGNEIEIIAPENSSDYILNIILKSDFHRNDSETIMMFLDINSIAASSGAACASGTLKPSHVILATGRSVEEARGAIRFSFSTENTREEIDYTLEIVQKLRQKLRK